MVACIEEARVAVSCGFTGPKMNCGNGVRVLSGVKASLAKDGAGPRTFGFVGAFGVSCVVADMLGEGASSSRVAKKGEEHWGMWWWCCFGSGLLS